jgi:hypothetical protein
MKDALDILLSGCVRGAPRRIWGWKVRKEAIASRLPDHCVDIRSWAFHNDVWRASIEEYFEG